MVKQVSTRGGQASNSRAADKSQIPPPFIKAPDTLEPFLGLLDQSKVYIVHIDPLPWQFKRRIFTVPVVLNLSIALLLLWRWYSIAPTYWKILLSNLGNQTDATVDIPSTSWGQLAWIILKRTLNIFIDFILIRFILLWPLTFFFESPANPVLWRWRIGFQEKEIIVRMSRGWGAADLIKGLEQGEQNPFFKVRILPAIDKHWMRGKTGYLMMGKNWDLDFEGMIEATSLVEGGKMTLNDFQKTVLAYSERHGWIVWRVFDLDEGSDEEARKKIVAFKDRLTAMGKENLFFRWVELIQYESSQPGGFDEARQVQAVEKAKHAFEEQGVDFEEFANAFGGVAEMPGMEAKV